jgi:hypothetical protein
VNSTDQRVLDASMFKINALISRMACSSDTGIRMLLAAELREEMAAYMRDAAVHICVRKRA